MELPAANAVYAWSAGALVLGAVLAMVGTIGTLWSGSIRERYADQRLAVAEAETAKANAAAAQANAAAENARLEQDRIKATVRWRELTAQAAAALTNALRARPATVTLAYVANDPEAAYFTAMISRAFEAAKWRVQAMAISYSDFVAFNIQIPDQLDREVATVKEAFVVAGLAFAEGAYRQPGVSMNQPQNYGVLVVVGSKEPVSFGR